MSSSDAAGSYPLGGTVSKALLIITPAFAREREYVQYLKYKLYDAGFIVVREEMRLLNHEVAEKLAMELDRSPVPPMPPATTTEAEAEAAGGPRTPAGFPVALLPAAHDLVGTAYIFVVARTDCHALLQSFITTQLCGEDADVLKAFLEEHHAQGRELPFWTSLTARGATRAVALLFPRMLAETVPTSAVSREYVQANLKEALVPALAELAKQKPEDPLRWLAMQLLASNTHAPPMMVGPN
ncbi:Dpy-30 motif containing protein [Novymonas esmeraldas]|uniref:Dpy-30 motif containing protein n=1 Tax=Novymonas esmeraldas TaxID=1808958 RepID=A0AAW0EQF1_9TRYP